jgi:hypothetical protein
MEAHGIQKLVITVDLACSYWFYREIPSQISATDF